jgi:hypothetical protein
MQILKLSDRISGNSVWILACSIHQLLYSASDFAF